MISAANHDGQSEQHGKPLLPDGQQPESSGLSSPSAWWPHNQPTVTYDDVLALLDPAWQQAIATAILPREAKPVASAANNLPLDGGAASQAEPSAIATPPSPPIASTDHPGPADAQESSAASTSDEESLVERRIVEAIKLDVLGERENGNAVVFAYHASRRKTVEIKEPDKLSYARLLQIAGQPVKEQVAENVDTDAAYQKTSLIAVRNAICYLAGQKRLGEQSLAGCGCWQALNRHGHEQPGVVLVSSGEACLWSHADRRLERAVSARVGGRLVNLSTSKQWYDFGTLAGYLRRCDEEPEWPAKVIEEARQVFDRWLYSHQETSPLVLVGMVLSTWVQTIWNWRPQVALIGPSNSGKSVLFELLGNLFGPLGLQSSKSTAAGIRQSVQTNGTAVLCDEFEQSKFRDEIYEMIRASSRGDRVLRGTPGQKSIEFIVRHIFWIAAIESGMKRAPDRNRFIEIELRLPSAENAGKLDVPSQSEARELGQKLLAIAIRFVLDAKPLAWQLKRHKVEGVHSRVIESYAAPVSILAAAHRWSYEDAAALLEECVQDSEIPANPIVSDEDDVLLSIMRFVVKMDRTEKTVGQMLTNRGTDYLEALERFGIKIVSKRNADGEFLFVGIPDVCHALLRGTQWEHQNIEQILRRIAGAKTGEHNRHRVGGMRRRGVSIPMEYIERQILGVDPEKLDSFAIGNTGGW